MSDNKREFYFKTLTGKSIIIEAPCDYTVNKIKQIIAVKENEGVNRIRIIVNGKEIEDDKILSETCDQRSSILHLVYRRN